MSTHLSTLRLRQIAAGHPAARRHLLARRNVLPRDDSVIAVSGLWAHEQLLRLGGSVETFFWCPGDRPDSSVRSVADALAGVAETSYEISERTLARLHPGTTAPGLLSVVRIPRWNVGDLLGRGEGPRVLLVADGIEYAGNLGALVRTVDASGAAGMLITNPVARLTHPVTFSASRGTVLTTPTLELPTVDGARGVLERSGFDIVVADPDAAEDFRAIPCGRRTAIVVGSEGSGVSSRWRAPGLRRVAISMRGRADSLNVATAAAILLFAP